MPDELRSGIIGCGDMVDKKPPSKPNILILLADDLGYADVSFNKGEIPTPNIDRIANEGVMLANFYACPVCSPTRAGLLTGRYPIRFGCMASAIPPWRDRGLPQSEDSLAGLARRAGYQRRGIIGKWHLGHRREEFLPTSHGFTSFYGHYNGAVDYFDHTFHKALDWHRDTPEERLLVREEGYTTDLIAKDAVDFIQDAARDGQPFFLYVPFNAPHSPFQAKPEDVARFGGSSRMPHRARQTYKAMVHSMDRAVGRILDALDRTGQADNTFVLFFSDNGGVKNIGDNSPFRGHKFNQAEGALRVAAAARWPRGGIRGGETVSEGTIGYIDVYPTLKQIMGMDGEKSPNPLDGLNILPVLQGREPAPPRDWFGYLEQGGEWVQYAAIRYPMKLAVYTKDINNARPDEYSLYDIAADPGEKTELNDRYPALCDELVAELQAFKKLQRNKMPRYDVGKTEFVPPREWVVP
jgi:arylsulfatase A-like enzyme